MLSGTTEGVVMRVGEGAEVSSKVRGGVITCAGGAPTIGPCWGAREAGGPMREEQQTESPALLVDKGN